MNVFGIKAEYITCRHCGMPAMHFKIIGTELMEVCQETNNGNKPKVIGAIIGFVCQLCMEKKEQDA